MAIISFSTTFNLSLSTPQFQFTDTSNYAGQGISSVYGAFQIISPSGSIIYDKGVPSSTNYDINYTSSHNNSTTIHLPQPLENGVYTLNYNIIHDTTIYDSTTVIVNLVYASPVVSISGSVQVYTPSPLLTMTNNTVWVVNSVTPTLSKTDTITYPPILINNVLTTPTPTVNIGTSAITTSTTFYTPTQVTMSSIANLTYVFSNFTVIDKVSGEIPFEIDATSFCKLYCGLSTFQSRVNCNPQDEQLAEDFSYMMGMVALIMFAQNCGKPDAIAGLIEQIQAVGNFNDDCGCGSSVQQVIGLGSLVNSYNVLGANSNITVTPVTAGNVTTFTIQLNDNFVNQVNAILGATLVQGDNIVLSSVTVGQNTTWTINALGASVTSNNGSVLVTPATTGNNTDYDLSLVTYAQTQLTTVTLSAPSTDYAIFGTPIQVSEAGTYMMFFEADLARTSSLDINAQYHPYKDSAPTVNISTFGSTDYRVVSNDVAVVGDTQVTKLTMNTTVNLLRLDTINININAGTLSAAASILKASILLIKIG